MSKSKKPVPGASATELIYPELKVFPFLADAALTVSKAKEFIGWESETEEVKYGEDFDLKDEEGNKVRLLRNANNRPLNEPWMMALAQDILNKRWKPNGETIIVGQRGNVLSGQHRLIALILADQLRNGKALGRADYTWGEGVPVTMECLVVVGVDESPATTRTLDNVRPRTLSDVLFCDPTVFAKEKAADRIKLVKTTSNAVKMLWHRMSADTNAFNPKRTHGEALAFIESHPRILKAVRHAWTEDKEGKALKADALGVGPGYAAALLYLMGACESDGEKYHHKRREGEASEKSMKWGAWDKACQFWSLLIKEFKGTTEGVATKTGMEAVRQAYAVLIDNATGPGFVSQTHAIQIIVKAWKRFHLGLSISAEDCSLNCTANEDTGTMDVTEKPLDIGGVDLTTDAEPEDTDDKSGKDDAEPIPEDDPNEPGEDEREAIERRKKEVIKARPDDDKDKRTQALREKIEARKKLREEGAAADAASDGAAE